MQFGSSFMSGESKPRAGIAGVCNVVDIFKLQTSIWSSLFSEKCSVPRFEINGRGGRQSAVERRTGIGQAQTYAGEI